MRPSCVKGLVPLLTRQLRAKLIASRDGIWSDRGPGVGARSLLESVVPPRPSLLPRSRAFLSPRVQSSRGGECVPDVLPFGRRTGDTPSQGRSSFVAHARLGRLRRTASSLRHLEGYGPREAALSASFPLGGASGGSARLSPAGGAWPSRRQEPGHLQSGSAAGPHRSGSTRFSLSRDRPRLLLEAPEGGGHPPTAVSAALAVPA
ncbi:hypothetical protein NDU88_000835 [Pleurodeles waltl]|uniref:Uncharacterized protein n=1 Tax=Pleurodeles waltl TaxID=8319 RepID=A0AAV7LVU4_PLEWA|nr:hypothetical protein NDU88_000835 [Pleurodeles waltl]